jgi:hypothetical protein
LEDLTVKFRTVPPDPREFPKAKLLSPWLVPVGIACIAWGADRAGHVWNIHGDAIALIVLFFLSLVVGFTVLAFTLPQAIRALLKFSSLRTPANVLATGAAAAFMGIAAFYVGFAIVKVTAQ